MQSWETLGLIVEQPPGVGGGGTLDFKWQGWSKDFFGFEIFDFGIFLSRKILASIFWGSLI